MRLQQVRVHARFSALLLYVFRCFAFMIRFHISRLIFAVVDFDFFDFRHMLLLPQLLIFSLIFADYCCRFHFHYAASDIFACHFRCR